MKVYLNHIGEAGLDVEEEFSPEFIGLTADDYLWFIAPVVVFGHLDRFDEVVVGNFTIKSRFSSYCYRTFEKIERDWVERFQLDFQVDKTTEYLELDEDIRQEIMLRVPMRVLSDKEMEKDKSTLPSPPEPREMQKGSKYNGPMYKPFENLKDLDNT